MLLRESHRFVPSVSLQSNFRSSITGSMINLPLEKAPEKPTHKTNRVITIHLFGDTPLITMIGSMLS